MGRGIFRESTSLLCLRRSFHISTSKIPYGWQRKAYILDLASISRYIFASMDFRISFSRNEWLSFSERRSAHGTHGLSTRSSFFSCIPWIIVENYMLYLMLFVILRTFSLSSCFLLPLPCGLWFVVRLQSCFWFPSLLIAPLVFLNCSPYPTFLFEDTCPVWWRKVNWKMREMLLNCLLRNLIHRSISRIWILVIPDMASQLVCLSLPTSEVYTSLWIKTRLEQSCDPVFSLQSSLAVCI